MFGVLETKHSIIIARDSPVTSISVSLGGNGGFGPGLRGDLALG